MSDVKQDAMQSEDKSKTNGPTSRDRIIEAKQSGLDDRSAAEYAGIPWEEFERMLVEDQKLELDLLQARASGFYKHLKWTEDASQWQPHEFLLTRFFADKIPQIDAMQPDDPDRMRAQAVVSLIETKDLPNAYRILAEGIRLYKEQAAARRKQLPCATIESASRTTSA